MTRFLLLLSLTLAVASPAFAQQGAVRWFPFNPSTAVAPGSAVDASDLLVDQPGDDPSRVIDSRGRVLAAPDGHFYFSKTKKRAKFFGTNLTFGANFPPNADAPPQPGEYRGTAPNDGAERLAERLARMGVNLVRLHHMDNQNRPGGIWDPAFPGDTQHIDKLQLRRLDNLIYQLRRRGIYTNLNLHVSRVFRPGDGVQEAELFYRGDFNKGPTQFDPVMIELQKKYASGMLDHVNPYTGLRLADDPAVAFVEVTNEDSLFWQYRVERLNHDPAKPESLPPYYSAELDRLWNQWLKKRYGGQAALEAAWTANEPVNASKPAAPGHEQTKPSAWPGPAKPKAWLRPQGSEAAKTPPPLVLAGEESLEAGSIRRPKRSEQQAYTPARTRDLMQFYFEIERAYYDDMTAYLRKTVGAKALICGTAPFWFYPLDSEVQASLDFVDGHIYFDHPSWPGVRPWSRTGWVIKNRPFASEPFGSLFNIASGAVAGKPYTLSETNQPFPNEYEAEWLLWTATFGNFQDWDEVLQFDYGGSPVNYFPDVTRSYFSIAGNSVKAAQMPMAARIFLAGQTRPALGRLELVASHDELLGSGPGMNAAAFFKARGIEPWQAFRTAVRLSRFPQGAGPTYSLNDPAPARLTSDNRELALDRTDSSRPVYVVDSPLVHAVAGFPQADVIAGAVSLKLAPESAPFVVLTLQALDQRPVAVSGRLLLSVLSTQKNTGMQWNEARTSVDDRWGDAPSLMAGVSGELRLRLSKNEKYAIYALDAKGNRAEQVAAGSGEVVFQLDTPRYRTVWYEIVAMK